MDAMKDATASLVDSLAQQAGSVIKESTDGAAQTKSESLGDLIANYTCEQLNKKVPDIVSSITNNVIDKLNEKIDSEKFTTDFINVLQTKIIEDKTYSEVFFKKFDTLFDMVITEAKNRHDTKVLSDQDNDPNQIYEGAGNHKKTKRAHKSSNKKTKRVRFTKKK